MCWPDILRRVCLNESDKRDSPAEVGGVDLTLILEITPYEVASPGL